MSVHNNDTYTRDTVELDGGEFRGCVFTDCVLIYRGGIPPVFANCSFDRPQFSFGGPAGHTLTFLRALYHGGFQPIVERAIDTIRQPVPPDFRGGGWSVH